MIERWHVWSAPLPLGGEEAAVSEAAAMIGRLGRTIIATEALFVEGLVVYEGQPLPPPVEDLIGWALHPDFDAPTGASWTDAGDRWIVSACAGSATLHVALAKEYPCGRLVDWWVTAP